MAGGVTNLFRDETAIAEEPLAPPALSGPRAEIIDPAGISPHAFGLSGWCIVPAIAGVALLAAFPSKAVAENPQNAALYIIFNGAILLAGSLVGSLILFFVFGRSKPVASIAFVLVMGVMSAGRFVTGTIASAEASFISFGAGETTQGVASTETPKANMAQIAGTGSVTTPLKSPPLSKSMHRWVKTAAKLAATYKTARTAFEDAGGLDVSAISTLRDCNDRLSLLRRLDNANEAFSGYINSAPQTLRKLLNEDNVLPENIEPQVTAFVGGFDYDTLVSLRTARAEYIDSAEGMLGLLRDRVGQWKIDPASKDVIFKNERDTKAYAAHVQKAEAAAKRDHEIQDSINVSE